MTLRCDHCRRSLGLVVHRYWRMRFCSAACNEAYQRRLGDDTKAKIRTLDLAARGHAPKTRAPAGLRMFASVARRLAG
jgi:hypothetical protein